MPLYYKKDGHYNIANLSRKNGNRYSQKIQVKSDSGFQSVKYELSNPNTWLASDFNAPIETSTRYVVLTSKDGKRQIETTQIFRSFIDASHIGNTFFGATSSSGYIGYGNASNNNYLFIKGICGFISKIQIRFWCGQGGSYRAGNILLVPDNNLERSIKVKQGTHLGSCQFEYILPQKLFVGNNLKIVLMDSSGSAANNAYGNDGIRYYYTLYKVLFTME